MRRIAVFAAVAVVVSVGALVSCLWKGTERRGGQASPAQPAPSSSSEHGIAGGVSATAATRRLLLANEDGIVSLNTDGETVGMITRTPARYPRRLRSGDVIFVTEDLEVRKVSASSGEQVVGALPIYAHCRPPQLLRVQSGSDFRTDSSQQSLCFELLDRKVNVATLWVAGRMNLTTGEVEAAVVRDGSGHCPTEEKTAEALRTCASPKRVHAKTAGLPLPSGFSEEMRSPSGRWTVVSGPPSVGDDDISRNLFLMNTKAAEVYPIREGAWPAAVEPQELAPMNPESPSAETLSVVGESYGEWLFDDFDLLFVDGLLVTPGKGAVMLHGDIWPD